MSGTVLVDVAVAGDVVGGVEVVTAVADVGTVAFAVVYEVVAVAVSGAVVVNVLVAVIVAVILLLYFLLTFNHVRRTITSLDILCIK